MRHQAFFGWATAWGGQALRATHCVDRACSQNRSAAGGHRGQSPHKESTALLIRYGVGGTGIIPRTSVGCSPTPQRDETRLRSARRRDGGRALRLSLAGLLVFAVSGQSQGALPAAFQRQVLQPPPAEAPFPLRFFSTPVKTDSRGRIITGPTSDPVKTIVGAEAA